MPSGDEGTGLHAFDDLDPVSTVSALSALPQEPPRQPQVASRRSPPPPVPSRPLAPEGRPDTGITGARMRSAPPPLPVRAPFGAPPLQPASEALPPLPETVDASDDDGGFADEDTRVVSQAMLDEAEYVSSDAPGADAQIVAEEDSPAMASSADTAQQGPATSIDMDWDEEEVATQLRDGVADDEAAASGPANPVVHTTGRPSPFPAVDSTYPGNPSPFAQAANPFAAPLPGAASNGHAPPPEADWEDDAMTRVISNPLIPPETLPSTWRPSSGDAPANWRHASGDSLSPVSTASTLVGERYPEQPKSLARIGLFGAAAVALLATGFGVRSLLTNADPATVTLSTRPVDAEVLIDGRPLLDQKASPFMAQGLAADTPHTLTVRKAGYAEATQEFTVEAGETKELSLVELTPVRVETGLALTSMPAGAEIYVDGRKLDLMTPARITDMAPGLHVIRLVGKGGYLPWETQVDLTTGTMIELPTARLVADPLAQARARQQGGDRSAEVASGSRSSSRRSSSGRSSSRRERAPKPAASGGWASAAPVAAPAPVAAAPARSGGGSSGTLRINSRPWSQVYVDGRLVGNTPQMNLALPAGSHKIKLVNPQLGMTKNVNVKIQPGKVETKIVDMVE